MIHRYFMTGGAVVAALAVALGAFGAHGLKDMLTPEMLAIFETGVRYLIVHAIALFLTGLFGHVSRSDATRSAGIAFLVGMVLFSGSLIVLATTGIRWLGAVAPVGGTALILGWLLLAVAAWKTPVESG